MLPVLASKAEAAAAMAPPKRLVAINYRLGFHDPHLFAKQAGSNDNARLCNLFVQMAHRMEVATDRFGSNDGTSVKGLA